MEFMQLCICRRCPDAQLNYRLSQNVTVSSRNFEVRRREREKNEYVMSRKNSRT